MEKVAVAAAKPKRGGDGGNGVSPAGSGCGTEAQRVEEMFERVFAKAPEWRSRSLKSRDGAEKWGGSGAGRPRKAGVGGGIISSISIKGPKRRQPEEEGNGGGGGGSGVVSAKKKRVRG